MAAASGLPSHPIYCPNRENLPSHSETFDTAGPGGTSAGFTRVVKPCNSGQDKNRDGRQVLTGPSSHMGATGAVAQPPSLEHCMVQRYPVVTRNCGSQAAASGSHPRKTPSPCRRTTPGLSSNPVSSPEQQCLSSNCSWASAGRDKSTVFPPEHRGCEGLQQHRHKINDFGK